MHRCPFREPFEACDPGTPRSFGLTLRVEGRDQPFGRHVPPCLLKQIPDHVGLGTIQPYPETHRPLASDQRLIGLRIGRDKGLYSVLIHKNMNERLIRWQGGKDLTSNAKRELLEVRCFGHLREGKGK